MDSKTDVVVYSRRVCGGSCVSVGEDSVLIGGVSVVEVIMGAELGNGTIFKTTYRNKRHLIHIQRL